MLEKLNDKGMEGRKSNGLLATRFLEAATLKLPSQVHWSLGEKWKNLRSFVADKVVISLGCEGLRGKGSLLVGSVSKNINS
jgi:hypothetical protein